MKRYYSTVYDFVEHCAKLAKRYTKSEAQELIRYIGTEIDGFQIDFVCSDNKLMFVVYSDCYDGVEDVEVNLHKYQDDDDDEVPFVLTSPIKKCAEIIVKAINEGLDNEEDDEEEEEEIDLSPPAPRVFKRLQLAKINDDE